MIRPDPLYAAELTIDLSAIAENYALIQSTAPTAEVGAAVKADAYGLGLGPVAQTLWAAGCRHFFVAHPGEGLDLLDTLPEANVHVLNGPLPGAIDAYLDAGLIPVLNCLEDITLWRNAARDRGRELHADIHFDTGMCRLGLDLTETKILLDNPDELLAGVNVGLVISHLASADDVTSDQSDRQLTLFQEIRSAFTHGAASFSNSAGVFRGPDYHFDLIRCGIALYGGNPTPHTTNPMQQTVKLRARILQVREIAAGETVGYGATFKATQPTLVATVPVGYADGYHRIGSGIGTAHVDGHPAPVLGRVSMDLITLDVSDVPETSRRQGNWVEFLGEQTTADMMADHWQTISYEVLTSLGRRYRRVYEGTVA